MSTFIPNMLSDHVTRRKYTAGEIILRALILGFIWMVCSAPTGVNSPAYHLRVNFVGEYAKETIRVIHDNVYYDREVLKAGRSGFFVELPLNRKPKDHERIDLFVYRKRKGLTKNFVMALDGVWFDEEFPVLVVTSKKYYYAPYNMRELWVENPGGFGMPEAFWFPLNSQDSAKYTFKKVESPGQ